MFPPEPEGLSHILAWDLSSLRPWEYWQVDAEEWTDATIVKQAFEDGAHDYHKEVADRKKREMAGQPTPAEAASIARLKGQMG